MANTVIQLKFSTETGQQPLTGSLANGELAINSADGKLFYQQPDGTISSIVTFPGPSGLDTEVQFNDGGTLGANAGLTFDKTSGVLHTSNVTANAVTAVTYFQFPDGTKQYTANASPGGDANDSYARIRANSAFDKANSAYVLADSSATAAAAAVIIGAGAYNKANVAHEHANAAFAYANTLGSAVSAGIYANAAFLTANTALDAATSAGLYANAAFLAANNATDTYVRNHANAAFDKANTTYDTATAAFIQANTALDTGTSAGIYANGSFTKANTATDAATSAGIYANGSFIKANTALDAGTSAGIYANGSFTVANAATVHAGAGFNQANTALDSGTSAGIYANGAFDKANTVGHKADSAFIQANAAFDLTNTHIGRIDSGMNYVNAAFLLANTVYLNADNASNYANGAFAAANVADSKAVNAGAYANAAFIRANNSLDANNGGLINAPITVNGNISVGGNISLFGSGTSKISSNNFVIETKSNTYTFKEDGTVAFPHYTFPAEAGNTSQVLVYDGAGHLIWTDLTANTVTYTANSVALTNGVYISGSVADIQTYGDYITGGYYNFTDGTGSGPAWILDVDFVNVTDFNRVILNINYTQNSGHTVYVQLYNTDSSTWDSIGSYNGLSGYYQFALAVIESTNYVSGGTVLLRLYHNNSGNALHETRVDYIALEKSTQGPQGPKGLTGATGPEGNSNTANAAFAHANAAFETANTKLTASGDGTFTGNLTVTGDLSVGGNVVYTGNVTSVTITGNTGQFFGDTYGFGALYAGIPTGYVVQPQTVFQSSSDFDGTSQINNQNINNGIDASTDFVATADNGSNDDTYIDMGINSSTYDNPVYGLTHRNDGYLYVSGNTITGGGNLILGTMTTNDIVFAVQGQTHDNEVMRISYANTVIIRSTVASTDTTSGALQVAGGVGVQGSIYAGAVYSGGNEVLTTSSPFVISSYDHANAAFEQANTGGGGTITFASEPPASGNANGDIWISNSTGRQFMYFNDTDSAQWVEFGSPAVVDNLIDSVARSNTDSSSIYANGAFTKANTVGDTAISAFTKANTVGDTAISAFIQANAVWEYANTLSPQDVFARNQSNSAFIQANSAYIHANAVWEYANTLSPQDTYSRNTSNAAYIQANTSTIIAQASFDYANTLATQITYDGNQANSAFIQANAAFEKANTGGNTIKTVIYGYLFGG